MKLLFPLLTGLGTLLLLGSSKSEPQYKTARASVEGREYVVKHLGGTSYEVQYVKNGVVVASVFFKYGGTPYGHGTPYDGQILEDMMKFPSDLMR
jgi:hypothetical protein